MAQTTKAKVFMTGRSQAVRIPMEFRFVKDEVFIRRDPQSGDVILSEKPNRDWNEIFAALDAAGFPDDLWSERDQGLPQERPGL